MKLFLRGLPLVTGTILGLGACTSVLGTFDTNGGGGSGGGAVIGECAAPTDCTLGDLDAACTKVECVKDQCLASFFPKGSECGEAKGRCDGAGYCRECLGDVDCAKGTCIDGLCSEKALGEVCGDGQQCASGFCVFGLCCDRECVGACEACNLPTKEGTCQVAPLGSVGEPACAPFLCDGASGSCPKDCTANEQCAEGRYCDGATKACELKKDNAATCTDDAMCKSGECYKGTEPSARCCATACACGNCATGECVVTATPGTDPKSECGNGTCDGLLGCSTKGEPVFVVGFAGSLGTLITPNDVAVDAKGNTYVVGSFSGTVSPSGKSVTSLGLDGFVLKLTEKGAVEWFLRVGQKAGLATQTVTGVTLDEDGTVLVVGNFSESVSLGASTTDSAAPSVFVARLDPAGMVLSSAAFKFADASGSASAFAIDCDGKGNVVIGGSFTGKFTLAKSMTSAGESDGFVAKLDGASLKALAELRLGGPGSDVVNSIDLAPSNVLAIGGRIGANATLAGKMFTNQGSADAFVALATVGMASIVDTTAAVYGSTGFDEVRSVVQAPNGGVFIGGGVVGGVNFAGGNGLPTPTDDSDPFIVGLSGKLTHLWTQRYASTDASSTQGLALDSAGFLVSVGRLAGTMTPKTGMTLTSQSGTDGWILKHHPGGQNLSGGTPIWAVTPKVALSTDIVHAVTTTPERDIVVAGSFGGDYVFAGTPLSTAGDKDVALFVARLRQ
ncbi:MAG: hypothetical protein FJ095_06515 [Deltaproteobacteria bacterium]|nr:hypothetical protein [Deltaproteobacteria bacterium]